jgi:hypothetical protein
VCDVSIVEPSDEVEFNVVITEVIEQPSAASEEDLNEVDLHLSSMTPGSAASDSPTGREGHKEDFR